MAADRWVLVRALKNFDEFEKGKDRWVRLTVSVAHLVANQYLTVLEDPWRVSVSTEPN